MEVLLSEKLRLYGASRTVFLDQIFKHIPRTIFEHNTPFHALIVFCTTIVIIAVFATTRSLTLFSLHPICMTIGTFAFIGEGLVSFRNGSLLEVLSPIMQHNKKTKVHTFPLMHVQLVIA